MDGAESAGSGGAGKGFLDDSMDSASEASVVLAAGGEVCSPAASWLCLQSVPLRFLF